MSKPFGFAEEFLWNRECIDWSFSSASCVTQTIVTLALTTFCPAAVVFILYKAARWYYGLGLHAFLYIVLALNTAYISETYYQITWYDWLQAFELDGAQVNEPEVNEQGPIPANTRRWPNAGLILCQRRRRWANIKPALGQRLLFA